MAIDVFIEFESGGAHFALRRGDVDSIEPVPHLVGAPASAPAHAGFFELGGALVSVVNFNALIGGVCVKALQLYDHLVVLKAFSPKTALLVDRVSGISKRAASEIKTVSEGQVYKDAVIAEISCPDGAAHLLDIAQLLGGYERERIRFFFEEEQRRRDIFDEAV